MSRSVQPKRRPATEPNPKLAIQRLPKHLDYGYTMRRNTTGFVDTIGMIALVSVVEFGQSAQFVPRPVLNALV